MAHEEYTGKSAGTSVTLAGAALNGWRQITITEKGRPAAEQLDITTAGDTAYQYMTNPLGAKGTPSVEVQVEGLQSVTDHKDGGLLSKAMDSTATVVVKKAADGDMLTVANAVFKSHETSGEFAGVVVFTSVFGLDAAAGVWATAS